MTTLTKKQWMWKIVEWLTFYASIPGGIILAIGAPGQTYKMVILISYLIGSTFTIMYSIKTKQPNMLRGTLMWMTIELYGMFGKSIINFT